MTDENTPEQIAAHEAIEERVKEEATWSVYIVELSGDDTEWEPRPNPDHWHEEVNEDGDVNWVPNQDKKLSESGKVVMPATCTVTLKAKNDDHAKMTALRAEEGAGYHTVVSVTKLNG